MGGAAEEGGDYGEVVLVFEEVGRSCGDCVVEGVEEGGVEGAEGEFVDYVGEVEGWVGRGKDVSEVFWFLVVFLFWGGKGRSGFGETREVW